MSPLPVSTQVSAGGVAYRQNEGQIEVALILVGPRMRWQLPKGSIDPQETPEDAALREVREEAGIETDLLGLLDRIEYWFYVTRGSRRIRFHKFVHFYLLRYRSGDVNDHDHEVEEARWLEINQAIEMLAFDSEKDVVRKAYQRIQSA
jgi:8-oxo-dGTP diphosphatase